MNPRLYLETTIPSYLVARPSKDLRLAADQQATKEWWENRRQRFELFVSDLVLRESRRGDAQFATARLEKLRGITILARSDCSGMGSFLPLRPMMPLIWALPQRIIWTFC
ncbi:MAG: hypothetical protein NTW03_05025 [Verrucomicrobia bacterium]|nr:hypothetical protein [Verrucomicrobiota bacterium]